MSHRFPKRERLRSQDEFARLFREGRKGIGIWMNLYAAPSTSRGNRAGVSCEKGFRSHVLRNRCKRRLRECYRLGKHRLRSGFDLVLIAKKKLSEEPPFAALQEEFLSLAGELGVLKNEKVNHRVR